MNIKFKNGSEIHTIPATPTAASSRKGLTFPLKFIKDFIPEIWNELSLFQRFIIRVICIKDKLKNKFTSHKTYRCPMCNKRMPPPRFPTIYSRQWGKTNLEFQAWLRPLFCSAECFVKYWNDSVAKVIETEKRD